MMRVCHLNTCPVGVATQDPRLREKFAGKPEHVVNFMRFIAQELREIMAQLGFRTLERDGRPRRPARAAQGHRPLEGASGFDFSATSSTSRIVGPEIGRFCQITAGPRPGQVAGRDHACWSCASRPSSAASRCSAELPIRNVNRVVGTIIGSEITRRWGAKGLPEDTDPASSSRARPARASARSCRRGMTFRLEGDANDYVGKGLSGGKIIVYPPAGSTFVPEENIIIGNVAFYGATSGEAYIRGMAGERFACATAASTPSSKAWATTAAST